MSEKEKTFVKLGDHQEAIEIEMDAAFAAILNGDSSPCEEERQNVAYEVNNVKEEDSEDDKEDKELQNLGFGNIKIFVHNGSSRQHNKNS